MYPRGFPGFVEPRQHARPQLRLPCRHLAAPVGPVLRHASPQSATVFPLWVSATSLQLRGPHHGVIATPFQRPSAPPHPHLRSSPATPPLYPLTSRFPHSTLWQQAAPPLLLFTTFAAIAPFSFATKHLLDATDFRYMTHVRVWLIQGPATARIDAFLGASSCRNAAIMPGHDPCISSSTPGRVRFLSAPSRHLETAAPLSPRWQLVALCDSFSCPLLPAVVPRSLS